MADLFYLFWLFFKIGILTIGGGMAIVPLIQEEMISRGYMTVQSSIDIIAISQMTPGPFAINAATFVGMSLYGLAGATFATLGMVLPSIVIVLFVSRSFFGINKNPLVQSILYGVRPVVLGLIAYSGIGITFTSFFGDKFDLLTNRAVSLDLPVAAIAVVLSVLMLKTKISPIWYIAAAGIFGAVFLRG